MPTTTPDRPTVAALAAPLLDGMAEGHKRTISAALVARPVRAGEVLIAQGSPNDRLWFVGDGEVAVERAEPGGRVARLATFPGPAIFGTTTFYRPGRPSMTIRAASDLAAWTLDPAGLDAIREADPAAAEALALAVVRALSEHFDLLDRKLADLLAARPDDDRPRITELAAFRARMFADSAP